MGQLLFIGNGGGGGGSNPLLTPLDLYVAPLTGNDANAGTTPAAPVQTMAGAYARIPTFRWGAPVRIHVAQGLLEWTPIPDAQSHNMDGQIIVIADGAGQGVETGFLNVIPNAPADVGTANDVIKSAAALAPDTLQGYTIFFSTGACVGEIREIRNNTATDIILTAPFTATPLPGDQYVVVAPATTVSTLGGVTNLCAGAQSCYPTIINLNFDGTGNLRIADVACLKMYGCTFTNGSTPVIENSQVFAGITDVLTPIVSDTMHLGFLWSALGAVKDWINWGISSPDGSLNGGPLGSFTGCAVARGVIFVDPTPYLPNQSLTFTGGAALQGLIYLVPGSSLFLFSTPGLTLPFLVRKDISLPAAVDIAFSQATCIFSPVFEVPGTPYTTYAEGLMHVASNSALLGAGLVFPPLPMGYVVEADENSTVILDLTYGDLNLNYDNSSGFFFGLLATRGSTIVVEGDPSTNFNFSSVGGVQGVAAFALQGSKVLITDALSATGPTCNFVGSNNVVCLFALNNSYGQASGNCNFDTIGVGFQAILGSSVISSGSVNMLSTALCILAVNSSDVSVASPDQTWTTVGNVITADIGSDVFINGGFSATQLGPSTNPAIMANQGCFIYFAGGLGLDSTLPGGACVVLDGAELVVTDTTNLQADGSALIISARGGAQLPNNATSQYTSAVATAILLSTGGALNLQSAGGCAINSGAGDGIDCTGGGQCYVDDGSVPPVFTVTGAELKVSPTLSNTFAAALPNPGDTFGNPGGGSTITRAL